MSRMGGLKPDDTDPDNPKQHDLQEEYLRSRLDEIKTIQQISFDALKDALGRATDTQSWLIVSNKIMFWVGICLIFVAVVVGYVTDKSAYTVLFGGVGFLQIVASFFVGSMQRSQKAISDLVQVEIAYLNYFEQTTLWEQYASIKDSNGQFDTERIEKAIDKIHTCTKETIQMLQTSIEDNASQ
jgi:hypothetical protein